MAADSSAAMLHRIGWALLALAAAGASVALGAAWLAIAEALGVPARWDPSTTALVHGLCWPLVAGGLVGLGLLDIATAPTERPGCGGGALAVGIGAVAALIGGSVALAGLPRAEAGAGTTWLAGASMSSAGWSLGGLGIVAVAVRRRAGLPPLAAALAAAAVHTVSTEPVAVWGGLTALAALHGSNDLWINLRLDGSGSVEGLVLGAGVCARIARSGGAPVALDRSVAALWFGVVAIGLVEGTAAGAGPWATAAALAAAVGAVALYGSDAIRRGQLQLRVAQPYVLLALGGWGIGMLGAGGLGGWRTLLLHDTYAEVGAEHLLGPLLACVLGLAGALDLDRRVADWRVWLGACACAAILGVGVAATASAFASLGLEGMPRRYYSYHTDGVDGWVMLAVGAAAFGAGLWASVLGGVALAVVRSTTARRERSSA